MVTGDPERRRPDIVLFNPDSWRGDVLGHVGDPAVQTPVLDRLVTDDAVSFAQTYCQNPVCTPSRASFMTGLYPHTRGHRTMYHMLQPDEPMLLRELREAGYVVWWGGKNDVIAAQHGYDAYCDVKFEPPEPVSPMWGPDEAWRGEPGSRNYYSFLAGELPVDPEFGHYHDSDWANVLGAVDFVKQMAGDERPLCVYLPIFFPHSPYCAERPWYGTTDRTALPPRMPEPSSWDTKPAMLAAMKQRQGLGDWDESEWGELRATYYDMCARVDHQLGLLIDGFKHAGRWDDTALFFFSDHGEYLGDYGLVERTQNTFEDALTRVPMIVRPPRDTPVRPGVRDCLVELLDLYATVADFAGTAQTHTHFSRSLRPALADTDVQHRDALFCEGGRLHGEAEAMELESHLSQVPTGKYYPRLSLQASDDGPYHGKATMCRTSEFKYVRRLYESDELYDLRSDPGELTNIIDDPRYSEIATSMRDRLLTWYQTTTDTVPWTADAREWPIQRSQSKASGRQLMS